MWQIDLLTLSEARHYLVDVSGRDEISNIESAFSDDRLPFIFETTKRKLNFGKTYLRMTNFTPALSL